MHPWLFLLGGLVAAGLLWWLGRRDAARRALSWDPLARAFMLGFDPLAQSIRGKYRLLRLELIARRPLPGLGPWRTRVLARYEGVVPDGLELRTRGTELQASARSPEALAHWLDAHRRRELLPGLLRGGVHVSGHTASVEMPGLLADPEALRTLLGQLAELAKLLSQR